MSKKNILTLSWAPRWRENPVYPDKQIHLLPSTKAASKNREYDYRFCFLRMMDECMLNCVRLFVTPWTVVCQASLSMEFSRQEYCSGLPFPTPRDLPDPGIEPTSPGAPALVDRFFATALPGKLFVFWRASQPPKDTGIITRCNEKEKSIYIYVWRQAKFLIVSIHNIFLQPGGNRR